ncbi:MAG: hypothetical protein IT427_02715 [Pirellulales bacterium]|nr:hypothetical protein [Pirellulales bacterium]
MVRLADRRCPLVADCIFRAAGILARFVGAVALTNDQNINLCIALFVLGPMRSVVTTSQDVTSLVVAR